MSISQLAQGSDVWSRRSIDAMGNVRNRSGQVVLPPLGGEILWRSDARLMQSEAEVFLNDTFIIGCSVGNEIGSDGAGGDSGLAGCEFQYKVVCAGDMNLRLVDHAREAAWANTSRTALQDQLDLEWQQARAAALNASCGNATAANATSPGSAGNISSCNKSVPEREVRPPLQFVGSPPLMLAKVWMQSYEWMLVPASQVAVSNGAQVKRCRRLACGCGMCPLANLSLIHSDLFNYSDITNPARAQMIAPASNGAASAASQAPVGADLLYKLLPYVVQGTNVTLHCNVGHRVGSHLAAAPRHHNVTCNAAREEARNYTALAASLYGVRDTAGLSSSQGGNASLPQLSHPWNCGFGWPPPCQPVRCGRYRPPPNSTVLSADWSAEREFYYDAAAAPIRVRCHPGFYTSLTNPVECSQAFEVSCSAEGLWSPHVSCLPLRCSLSSLRTVGTAQLPDDNLLIRLPPAEGNGTFLAREAQVSVGFAVAVNVRCAQDYQRSKAGSIAPVCMDKCQLAPAVISCSLFAGTCPPWDTFELGPGVELNGYLRTLATIPALRTRELQCKVGYKLDNSNTAVVVAGLGAISPSAPFRVWRRL